MGGDYQQKVRLNRPTLAWEHDQIPLSLLQHIA